MKKAQRVDTSPIHFSLQYAKNDLHWLIPMSMQIESIVHIWTKKLYLEEAEQKDGWKEGR